MRFMILLKSAPGTSAFAKIVVSKCLSCPHERSEARLSSHDLGSRGEATLSSSSCHQLCPSSSCSKDRSPTEWRMFSKGGFQNDSQ